MGRPKTTNRTIRLELKLSERENALLNKCVELSGETRTDIIAKGISMLYDALQAKE